MHNISQIILGELTSSINEMTMRKNEASDKNPESNQLLKIANVLGIIKTLFMDFDIETASDVISLIFKMHVQVDVEF